MILMQRDMLVLTALVVPLYNTTSDNCNYSFALCTQGFLPLLKMRENWKAFFQSGKSQGIFHFLKKSGKNQGILMTQYFLVAR